MPDPQPRWPRGAPDDGEGHGQGGRWLSAEDAVRAAWGTAAWARRLSESMERRSIPRPPVETPFERYTVRERRETGYPVFTVDDNPADLRPVSEFGRDRGDGTYEIGASSLAWPDVAAQMAGRIETRTREPRSDGTEFVSQWRVADAITFSVAGGDIGLHTAPNRSELVHATSKIEYRPIGGRTAEDDFHDLRAAVGGESDEPAASLEFNDRYVDKYEVQNPATGEWSTIRHVEQMDDHRDMAPEQEAVFREWGALFDRAYEDAEKNGVHEDDVDEPWMPLVIETDHGLVVLRPVDWWGSRGDWGTVRVRPVVGDA